MFKTQSVFFVNKLKKNELNISVILVQFDLKYFYHNDEWDFNARSIFFLDRHSYYNVLSTIVQYHTFIPLGNNL